MRYRTARIVMWITLLPLSAAAFAGDKMYKYTDANGNIVYSDKPPADERPDVAPLQLKIPPAGNGTVEMQGSKAYCGDVYLGDLARPADLKRNLPSQSQQWQRELLQTLKDYEQELRNARNASASYQAEVSRRGQERMAKLQCAVAWADRQLHSSKIDDRVRESISGYEEQIAVLEQDRNRYCGPDPFPGVRTLSNENANVWTAWYECSKPYAKQIEQLQREKQLGDSVLSH
ncbi:MAG: DUF4124 domain-containing protein [Pseudomonadota bacterium]